MRIGWKYESARHSLAAKGISTGRKYMRWRPGHLTQRGEPSFLMWQTPHKDMLEAVGVLTRREKSLRRRVLDHMDGINVMSTAEVKRIQEVELPEIHKMYDHLLGVKLKEWHMSSKPVIPARESSIWEDVAVVKAEPRIREDVRQKIEQARAEEEQKEQQRLNEENEERLKSVLGKENADYWNKKIKEYSDSVDWDMIDEKYVKPFKPRSELDKIFDESFERISGRKNDEA